MNRQCVFVCVGDYEHGFVRFCMCMFARVRLCVCFCDCARVSCDHLPTLFLRPFLRGQGAILVSCAAAALAGACVLLLVSKNSMAGQAEDELMGSWTKPHGIK